VGVDDGGDHQTANDKQFSAIANKVADANKWITGIEKRVTVENRKIAEDKKKEQLDATELATIVNELSLAKTGQAAVDLFNNRATAFEGAAKEATKYMMWAFAERAGGASVETKVTTKTTDSSIKVQLSKLEAEVRSQRMNLMSLSLQWRKQLDSYLSYNGKVQGELGRNAETYLTAFNSATAAKNKITEMFKKLKDGEAEFKSNAKDCTNKAALEADYKAMRDQEGQMSKLDCIQAKTEGCNAQKKIVEGHIGAMSSAALAMKDLLNDFPDISADR